MTEVKIDLSLNTGSAPQTLGELEEKSEALLNQLKQVPIGSKAYKELNQELVQTNKQVKNLELGFEALDREQVASELGSVAGAVGDITGAVILMTGENENLEAMVANIEKGIGVSMAFKGAIEGASSAFKLLNNVMRANPIGAIITGITLLIAGIILLIRNWDDLSKMFTETGFKVKELTDRLGKMKPVILALLGPIGWLILAWEKVIEIQQEQMTEAEKNAARERRLRAAQGKAATKRHKKRLEEIKEEQKARKEAFEQEQEIFDLDIDRMEAEGKNADALKRAKLEATKEEKEAELQTISDLLASWTQYYEDLFAISGKSREDFLATMKGQGIDLEALQKEANDRIIDAQNEIFKAETELIRFNREIREKAHEETVEEINEEAELEKQHQQERLRLLQQIEAAENEFLNSRLSKEDQEINKVREKFFILIEEAKKFGEETALLEEAQATKIQEIRDKFREQERAAEEQAAKAREELREQQVQQAKDGAKELFDAANTLQQFLHDKEMKRAEEKTARGEKLTASEIKRLKRQDSINKAFALAQIAADTARGITGAIAAGAGIPFPLNLGAIASGIAAVISGSVQAAQVLGESVQIPEPNVDSAGGGAAGGSQNNNVPDIQSAAFGSTLLNDQKVFVVESDITGTQNKVDVIEQQATFG